MTKEQYELLVKQNLLARQRAAEMGQVVSTGGIDLSTGQRPAFKFGPIEIGDATDYGQLSDAVLADTAAVNRTLIEAGEAKAEEERKEKERLDKELKICGEYGLRAKKEIWRINRHLAHVRKAARVLLTLDEKDPEPPRGTAAANRSAQG